jgi:hypothetical protein
VAYSVEVIFRTGMGKDHIRVMKLAVAWMPALALALAINPYNAAAWDITGYAVPAYDPYGVGAYGGYAPPGYGPVPAPWGYGLPAGDFSGGGGAYGGYAPVEYQTIPASDSAVGLWCFFAVAGIFHLRQAWTVQERRRGRAPFLYNRYSGWPRLARLFPNVAETTLKRFGEPLAAALLAACVYPLSPLLTLYLLVAVVCLHGKASLEWEHAVAVAEESVSGMQEQAVRMGRIDLVRGGGRANGPPPVAAPVPAKPTVEHIWRELPPEIKRLLGDGKEGQQ